MSNEVAVYEEPKPIRDSMIGRRFGRLLVYAFSHVNNHKAKCYICFCDCGTKKVIHGAELRNGKTQSCGCLCRERAGKTRANLNYKHGGSNTPLYRSWRAIIERCNNNNHISYKHYGGKGIKVCNDWLTNFASFRDWACQNGYSPKLSIDRIDNSGDYSPSNCRWITKSENIAKSNRERKFSRRSA